MSERLARDIFGVDIGGTKCAVSVRRRSGRLRELHRFATGRPADTLAEIARVIRAHRPAPDAAIGNA